MQSVAVERKQDNFCLSAFLHSVIFPSPPSGLIIQIQKSILNLFAVWKSRKEEKIEFSGRENVADSSSAYDLRSTTV